MENQLIPYEAMKCLGRGTVLVLAPHPDDEVFGCGGAILRHLEAGDSVQVIIITDGGYLGDDVNHNYIRQRQRESIDAARILGYGKPLFWGIQDRELQYGESLVCRLLRAIEEYGAEWVYAPSIFEAHPDHRALGMSAVEAVRRLGPGITLAMYEIGIPLPPNRLLDITDLRDKKSQAMACFTSQFVRQAYHRHVQALNCFRTYTLPREVEAAEAYWVIDGARLREDFLGIYASEAERQRRLQVPINAFDQPLVSVLVRTIGRWELKEALDSIALQTYPRIEVVVVDAKGNNDLGLEPWCGRFPLRVYTEGRPLARSVAANLALSKAAGDYLIFLDDDDWFKPEHIALLVEVLRNRQDVSVAYSSIECMQKNASSNWERVYLFNQSFDSTRLLVENYIPLHAALFRRDLIELGNYRFDESLTIYEDWDFWIQLAQKTPFIYVDRISAVYRISPSGNSGVFGNDEHVQKAQKIFFEKWRSLWSIAQVVDIAGYAKYKSMYQEIRGLLEIQDSKLNAAYQEQEILRVELENRNSSLQELHQSRETLAASLEAQSSYLNQTQDQWAQTQVQLDQTQEQLDQTQGQLEQTLNRLGEAINHIDRLSERITELENSHSWKITKPLRDITIALRKARQSWMMSLRLARRYFMLSYQILHAEGPNRLLARIYKKLFIRNRFSVPDISVHQVDNSWKSLHFARFEKPQASIVIPVHNNYLHTFTCLKSLAIDASPVSFEVIVVNDHSQDETAEMLAAMENLKVIFNTGKQGFVYACNLGARHASGEYLVFLNNDTIVPQGWLKTLLNTFENHNDAGLVGVRLVYPDGRLQEAGGIIWQDGSAWNYGRNDNADKPEYNYLRQVDYCSGACLAIPRQLFLDLGGFSEEFAPAYFEDADLAFKVTEAGKKVLYQPAVAIVHFEGVSSGTHTLSGYKSFQLINQRKFFHRWQHRLKFHHVNGYLPELEKDRGIKKRVLIIDTIMLMPDQDSGSLRMAGIFGLFQDLGFKVTFVASNLEYHYPYGAQFQQQGIEVLYAPFVYSIEKYLRENGKYFDVILISRADTAEKFLDMARAFAPSALLLFDTVDLHFLREERMAALQGGIFLAKAAASRKKQELALMEKADITLVVSPVEKDLISKDCPHLHLEVLSNIHDIYGSTTDFSQREGILFIGSFNHPPNADAVIYYVQEILPLVQRTLTNVKTYIVGSQLTSQIKALASETVIVTGYVPDVSEYFARCRLSIAPLRYGAGVKGKINLSMSYGVPVVATPIAVEGMHLTDGKDVIVGQDTESFADGVIAVYQERVLWERLSKNGLLNVEKHFSKATAGRVLRKILNHKDVAA